MKLTRYTIIKNLITIVISLIFCTFVFTYELHIKHGAEAKIRQHAKVIADSLWNLNMEGAAEYLRLIVATNDYCNLTVYEKNGVAFQSINNTSTDPFELFLYRVGLTPVVELKSDIVYQGQSIGQIEATWLPHTIITHLYVLFIFIFLTVTLHLYLRTHMDKAVLEDRVKERTKELAESNVTLLREIHEKKMTASILAKSEEEYRKLYEDSKNAAEVYRSLIQSSADAILICNLAGEVQYMSATFTELFGWKIEEKLGKSVNLSPPGVSGSVADIFINIRNRGVSYHAHETLGLTRDKKQIDISISGSRFNDHTGKPAGLLFVIRDISEQKRLKMQLQRSERLEAVGTLAGGIAHDFNNLLMGIQGNTSMAIIELQDDHPVQARLQAIDRYVKSSKQLTTQMLGFARGGKYEVKPTDINTLIREEMRLFARTRKDIVFSEDLQDNVWTVEVDKGQFRQVLLNLFVNASHAMEDGGSIHISTYNTFLENTIAPKDELPTGPYVQISISDSGQGIGSENIPRIFDPFFTTKELGRGTGLGLASVYGIIKNHEGFIDVSSELGEGTTFTILLPASESANADEENIEDDIEPGQGQGCILLIDDEEMILDVGTEILKLLGYDVITANSGHEACQLYAEYSDQISAVILDIIMPHMDGGAIFDSLRKINPEVKVLLSSGYSIDGKASTIMEKGCAGFLQKPFDIASLSKKLKEIS